MVFRLGGGAYLSDVVPWPWFLGWGGAYLYMAMAPASGSMVT